MASNGRARDCEGTPGETIQQGIAVLRTHGIRWARKAGKRKIAVLINPISIVIRPKDGNNSCTTFGAIGQAVV